PGKLRWAATAMATAMAATGAATFSQAGRTFNEVQTATLILSAVWLLTSSLGDITTSGRRGPALAAGVLLGAASGLKITSVIFAPAVLIALVLTSRRSLILRNASLLVLGGIVGLLISGGWWALKLYEAYGNPVFPFFNGIRNQVLHWTRTRAVAVPGAAGQKPIIPAFVCLVVIRSMDLFHRNPPLCNPC